MKLNPCRPLWRRFWPNVTVTPGCWIWVGATHSGGYGTLSMGAGAPAYAHRLSFALFKGPIPAGLWVLHRCDNPPCVNPDHLFLGTIRDNNADRHSKGRSPKGTRHGRARLTEDAVRELRKRAAAGEMQRTLAAEFGLSESHLSGILSGRFWAHLGGVS